MSTTKAVSIDEAVLAFLAQHRDPPSGAEEVPRVTGVRQEHIAAELDVPLGHIIEALQRLQQSGQLRAERQDVGKPFRYVLIHE